MITHRLRMRKLKMNNLMQNINFQTIDWSAVEKTEHQGETGTAYWQTKQFDGLRVRIVEYSPNYLADHWCEKGILCNALTKP